MSAEMPSLDCSGCSRTSLGSLGAAWAVRFRIPKILSHSPTAPTLAALGGSISRGPSHTHLLRFRVVPQNKWVPGKQASLQ